MKGRWIRKVWNRDGVTGRCLWVILLPLSWLYSLGVQTRNFCYSTGLFRARSLDQCVVSVGNLTVGGTGKTPACVWLAQKLSSRGLKVAILSRGYKRAGQAFLVLRPGENNHGGTALEQEIAAAGDEPVMMARIFGQAVAVGKYRYRVARQMVENGSVDVFLLDDGFQHRQLRRDIELLLLGPDAKGSVLPSGPFREPRRNLRRADAFLITGNPQEWLSLIPPRQRSSVFCGSLEPKCLVGLESKEWKQYPLGRLGRCKIVVVAGIADPSSLYRMVFDWEGDIVETLEFPDHHAYSSVDWQRINRAARKADLVVTTEKDILKLVRFPFARDKLLALRVGLTVENGDALIQKIVDKVEQKRISAAE